MLDELAEEIHNIAQSKGFWNHDTLVNEEAVIKNPSMDAEKIALMHSELSEALEALRDGKWPHAEEELADCIIRILDFAYARDMSMDSAIRAKMDVNKTRPYLHGRKW